MKRILISIMSEHVVPNFLYMREFPDAYDEQVFISSEQTLRSGVGQRIERALGVEEGATRRVKVSNDNFQDVMQALENAGFADENDYTVNLTGGTKIMSLAVYEFFKRFDAKFVYIPIGTNEFFLLDDGMARMINYRLSLSETLALYGMEFTATPVDANREREAVAVFRNISRRGFLLYKDEHTRNPQALPTAEERGYWSGQWFEDFVYSRLRDEYLLPADAIARGLKITRLSDSQQTANDNELDVAFMLDNRLYIVECKVGMRGYDDPRATVDKYLYKLAAVAKDLGLHVQTLLATLHPMQRFSPEQMAGIRHRCKVLGIRGILTGPDLAADKLNL